MIYVIYDNISDNSDNSYLYQPKAFHILNIYIKTQKP